MTLAAIREAADRLYAADRNHAPTADRLALHRKLSEAIAEVEAEERVAAATAKRPRGDQRPVPPEEGRS